MVQIRPSIVEGEGPEQRGSTEGLEDLLVLLYLRIMDMSCGRHYELTKVCSPRGSVAARRHAPVEPRGVVGFADRAGGRKV